jgi:hypothetical protein
MKETGNVFDVSTTLMEIDELPESEADPHDDVSPSHIRESEPQYFAAETAVKPKDIRRRGLAALALAAGGVLVVTMISAAVGMGDDHQASAPESGAQVEQSMASSPAAAVSPRPADRRQAHARALARARARKARQRERRQRAKARAHARRRHRQAAARHTAPAPASEPEATYTPEPETTYVPEPEATYVPVETEPAPAPPPASSGGGGQEFGIEP